MKNQKELTFKESIDQAIDILQQLRNQEHNNGAFILTTAHDEPTDLSTTFVSCVSDGSLSGQLNGLLEYISSDPRIMPALESYSEPY